MRKGTQAKKRRQLAAWVRFRTMTPNELRIARGYGLDVEGSLGDILMIGQYHTRKAKEQWALMSALKSELA